MAGPESCRKVIAMNQNTRNRLQKPFVPNSRIVFDIPMGQKMRKGSVILVGSIVVSAGTTSGTVFSEGGPAELIQRIRVNATPASGSRYPGGYIVDAGVRSLLRYATCQRSGKSFVDQGGSTLGAGAAGTYPIYTGVPLYFADDVQFSPLITALNLNAGNYSSVQVEVWTAALNACFTGNDRVVDYSGLQVQWADDRIDLPGDTSVIYQESHIVQIGAANSRMLDPAMPQSGAFMSWDIMAEQTAQANLSDALLNKVYISGPDIELEKYAEDIRQTDLDDEWYDPSNTNTGMFHLDFTEGVVQANTINAGTLDIYFDVNNPSGANLDDLNFFTRRLYAPQPATAAKA